jgi:flavin reductase (DIM6/NTAB) family NADH-FMN oxidoreductase RutF
MPDFGPRDFRSALGSFPTGVVVIAATVDGSPTGLAVNSFTSVSLDPPLVAFCADKGSSTWPVLRSAGGFTVNVLAAEQEDLCRRFAQKGADRFSQVEWTPGVDGHPRIDGVVTWLDCRIHAVLPGGDHEIVLGEVVALSAGEGEPLAFHRGRFGRLAPPPAPEDTPARQPEEDALYNLHGLDVAAPFFDVLASRLR